ncbi:MAG: hypothetical protein ABR613_07770 [Actinomycetota bacterium]
MRKLTALAFALAAALPVALAPAAHASDQFVTAEACPEGYKGVIVGYDHPKFGENYVFVCTNIV